VRGPAAMIHERYLQLARDASSSGDRVLSENFLQHADHYFRLWRSTQPATPPPQQMNERYGEGAEGDEDLGGEGDAGEDGEMAAEAGDQPDVEFPQGQQQQQQFGDGRGRGRGRRSRYRPNEGEGGGEPREAREGGEREGGGEDRQPREERPPREARGDRGEGRGEPREDRGEQRREPRERRPSREPRDENAGPEGFSSGPKPAFLRGGD
jgi:hypothetical protein